MTYGFTVQASYTWSHAMDDVSNGGIGSTPYNNSQSFGSLTYQINPVCLRCNNYGNADYDTPQQLQRQLTSGRCRSSSATSFANASSGRLDDVAELLLPLRPATLRH